MAPLAVALLLTLSGAFVPPGAARAAKEINDDTSRLLDQVRKLEASGRADSALAILSGRIAQGPDDGRLERGVVDAALTGGIPWVGVRVIEESLRQRPGDLNLHIALGELELGRQRPDVAIRHFQRALVIDSKSPGALGGFARARAKQGTDIEPALSYFDKLGKQQLGTPQPRYGKGVILCESGRVEESLTEFRWAVGLDDANWYYERDYGRALLLLGNEKLGIEHLEKAKRLLAEGGDPLTAERIGAEIGALSKGGS